MSDLDAKVFEKVVGMFYPSDEDFLNFSKDEVILGPTARAVIRFETYFPINWLIEDYGFTEEEARYFVQKVQNHHD